MDSRTLLEGPLATWVTETSFMLDLLYNCYIYFEPVDQFTYYHFIFILLLVPT